MVPWTNFGFQRQSNGLYIPRPRIYVYSHFLSVWCFTSVHVCVYTLCDHLSGCHTDMWPATDLQLSHASSNHTPLLKTFCKRIEVTRMHRRLQARACPGIARVISKHCALISQWPDAKTRSTPPDQHKRAYLQTYVCVSVVTIRFRNCSVAKSCPGTYTALQAPMHAWPF